MPLHTKSLPCPNIENFQIRGLINVWPQKLVKRSEPKMWWPGAKYIYQTTTTNCSLWVAKNYLLGQHPRRNCGTERKRLVKWKVSLVININICNMCGRNLLDISTLTLRYCMPLGSCIHIRHIPPAHVTYITYNTNINEREHDIVTS